MDVNKYPFLYFKDYDNLMDNDLPIVAETNNGNKKIALTPYYDWEFSSDDTIYIYKPLIKVNYQYVCYIYSENHIYFLNNLLIKLVDTNITVNIFYRSEYLDISKISVCENNKLHNLSEKMTNTNNILLDKLYSIYFCASKFVIYFDPCSLLIFREEQSFLLDENIFFNSYRENLDEKNNKNTSSELKYIFKWSPYVYQTIKEDFINVLENFFVFNRKDNWNNLLIAIGVALKFKDTFEIASLIYYTLISTNSEFKIIDTDNLSIIGYDYNDLFIGFPIYNLNNSLFIGSIPLWTRELTKLKLIQGTKRSDIYYEKKLDSMVILNSKYKKQTQQIEISDNNFLTNIFINSSLNE